MTYTIIQERLKLVISENENLEKESKRLKGSVAEYKVSYILWSLLLACCIRGKIQGTCLFSWLMLTVPDSQGCY